MCAGRTAPFVIGLQTLSQVADENKLIIAVGYMLRSSPAVIAAKQLMAEVRPQLYNCDSHQCNTRVNKFLHLPCIVTQAMPAADRSLPRSQCVVVCVM